MKCSLSKTTQWSVQENFMKRSMSRKITRISRDERNADSLSFFLLSSLKLVADWHEMRFVCSCLWMLQLNSATFHAQLGTERNASSQTIFILIKFNISWDDVLSALSLGMIFENIIPSGCRRNEKWILQKCSWRAPSIHFAKAFSLNIIFIRATGTEVELRMRRRNRLRKLWCSWDNKNSIKISKLMLWCRRLTLIPPFWNYIKALSHHTTPTRESFFHAFCTLSFNWTIKQHISQKIPKTLKQREAENVFYNSKREREREVGVDIVLQEGCGIVHGRS